MNPLYGNDTLILIDIQAGNKLEILTCVRETFEWWRTNDTFADTMDEDEVVIKDLADISYLLEFVYLNSEKLRDKVDLNAEFNKFFSVGAQQPEPPPKKRKKDETSAHKINVANLEKKLKEFQKDFHKPSFNPMVFVEESMSMPSANVYYKDFAPKDFTPEQYDTYYDKALYATSEGELIGLYEKTAGLHGPLATKLGPVHVMIKCKLCGVILFRDLKEFGWLSNDSFYTAKLQPHLEQHK
jgi:hypothetical protein